MSHTIGDKFNGWAWPVWVWPDTGNRREWLAGVLWPAVFLVFLLQPVAAVLDGHHRAWEVAAVMSLVVGFGLSYLAVGALGYVWAPTARTLAIAWLSLFPIGLAMVLGPDSLVFFTYVVSPALMLLPPFAGFGLGLAAAVSVLVVTRLVNGSADWNGAMILVVLTIAMFAFGGLVRTIRQLRIAQDKMARFAVAEERSRLARDLHDVLGHSLTTITVKAGLARRVLESSSDRQRALAEVRDVEDLARQAMTEVRATVSGYRTASLPAELAGARAALSAAGIAADLPHAVDDVAAALHETFAYVLREGVTNVIRHSGATRCAVRLGHTWLEVRDNGRPARAVGASRIAGGGHGLSGLAERMAAVGGALYAGPLPQGGYLLRASADGTAGDPVEHTATELTGQPAAGLA